MLPSIIKIKETLMDVLFPPLCLICRKTLQRFKSANASESANSYICDECFSAVKINNTLFCPVCRARLAENKRICHRDSRYLLAAAGNYDDPIPQNLIHFFKYRSFKNLAPILGKILILHLKLINLELANYVMVPIPLHPKRERERGFNQARLIAEIAAQNLNLEMADALRRIKNTKPQAQLKKLKKRETREENVLGCFQIKNAESVKNKNVVLVDDVFTSGATMNEAAKVLKESGAKRIIALVIAKT